MSTPFDIKSVVTRHAPLVRFHPDEGYFPSSVPWYLRRVEMWYRKPPLHARKQFDAYVILNRGQVNPTSLTSQNERRYRSDAPPAANQIKGRSGTYFLNIPDTDSGSVTRRGDLDSAVCYVHVQPSERPGRWYLAYLFFYPFNASISKIIGSEHEGDWEHIRVEVNCTGQTVHQIYMAAHEGGDPYPRYSGAKPNTVGYRCVKVDGVDHPIVYSARFSHATYPNSGRIKRDLISADALMPDDHTGMGEEWRTWDRLEVLGDRANPSARHKWLKFNGRWGQMWGDMGGPTGPAFKTWWRENGFGG